MKALTMMARALRAIRSRLLIMMDPVGYARSIGVQVGKDARFYGMTPGMFGSEPWLISLGDNVHVVAPCQFVNHDGGVLILRHRYPDLELTRPIKVGSNVYIGINSIILPGVTIGDNVIVGAGSVVTRDIPGNSVAAGVPARVIKSLDEYLARAQAESLGLGALRPRDKEEALKRHFGIKPREGPR